MVAAGVSLPGGVFAQPVVRGGAVAISASRATAAASVSGAGASVISLPSLVFGVAPCAGSIVAAPVPEAVASIMPAAAISAAPGGRAAAAAVPQGRADDISSLPQGGLWDGRGRPAPDAGVAITVQGYYESPADYETAGRLVGKFVRRIRKHTGFDLSDGLTVTLNRGDRFEYGADGGVEFAIRKEGYRGRSDLIFGIYHELGHWLSACNRRSADGRTHHQRLLDQKEAISALRKEGARLIAGGMDRETSRRLKPINEKIAGLNADLRMIVRAGGVAYEELFADLAAVVALGVAEPLATYFSKRKAVDGTPDEAFLRYSLQRDFRSESDDLYHVGRYVGDDVHLYFNPVRQHLFKHYLSNEKYRDRKFEVLEKTFRAIQTARHRRVSSDFHEDNKALIREIDLLFGEDFGARNIDGIRLIPASKLMERAVANRESAGLQPPALE